MRQVVISIGIVAAVVFSAFSATPKDADTGAFEKAFSDLAAEDQAEFVATVNRSLAKSNKPMDDRRIKTITRINRDAVRGTPIADRKKVLAEVFTTVPFDCLPSIVDTFSADLFNRRAFLSDEAFTEFAAAALMLINNRLRRTDDDRPGARSAYAVIMFLKAAGEDLVTQLREPFMLYVLTGSHVIARDKWIPAALGDNGAEPTYKPIIESEEQGEEPPHGLTLPHKPIESLNRLVGSELRTDQAWDVTGPSIVNETRGLVGNDAEALDGMANGLSRVPGKKDPNNPQDPWHRKHRSDVTTY